MKEERAKIFKIEKQVGKAKKDTVESKYVRDKNRSLKVKEEEVMERWRSGFSSLLNDTDKYQLEEETKWKGRYEE